MTPSRVWTGTSRYGAPRAGRGGKDSGRLAVSLTHTNGAVIAAASPDAARVGVDVERLDRTVRAEALARRYFAPAEADALESLPPGCRRGAFLRTWTLKEAWGKATGMGVQRALPLISFPVEDLARRTDAAALRRGSIAPAPAARFPGPWRFWTATVGIQSLGLAVSGRGRAAEPSLPRFPASAMIRRLDSAGSGPVTIYRMVGAPTGSAGSAGPLAPTGRTGGEPAESGAP